MPERAGSAGQTPPPAAHGTAPSADPGTGQAAAATAPAAAPPDPQISALKHKVMSAVRTAITESLADSGVGGQRATATPDLDLDFSMPAESALAVQGAQTHAPLTLGVTAASVVAAAPAMPTAAPPSVNPGPTKPPLADFSRNAEGGRGRYPRREAAIGGSVPLTPPRRRSWAGLWFGGVIIVAAGGVGAVAAIQPALLTRIFSPSLAPRAERQTEPGARPGTAQAALPATNKAPPVITSGAVKTASIADGVVPKKPEPRPVAAAAPRPAEKTTLLTTFREAQSLIGKGAVRAARERLLGLAESGGPDIDRAEVAFALARSYDANHLGTLTSADAPADRAEAERWYRRWYELSVKAGTVSDGAGLERLLRSLK